MNQHTTINSSSVVLVSGGGRGVTAQCVIKLAEQYRCKFILLGRSCIGDSEPEWAKNCFDESELKKRIMQDLIAQGEKPTPVKVQKRFKSISKRRDITNTISTIKQIGGEAEYISVDVTNSADLMAKLAPVIQRFGAITGIIHGAGNLADKLIEKKSEQDFETVYNTKIEGLESLLSCVQPSQLDFIVLFSSFVAFYGNPGQSDYALANEILNKYAYVLKRKYPNCRVLSIGWGPWDGGMVTPELKKFFAQQDMELISVDVGAKMLIDELNSPDQETPQILVMSRPILGSPKQLSPEKKTFRIQRKLTLAENPFVCDHVIASHPVLPAMCGISWLANTCEQLYPGYKFFSCDNYKVLKGIVFDNTLANYYTLDLKEINKSQGEIEFEAVVSSESTRKIPHYHYKTEIKLVQAIPQATTYESFNSTQDPALLSLSPYQNGTLFHKPRFQGVKRILNISPEGLTVQCSLPSLDVKQQGKFPVQAFNPYTADILFQALLMWVRYFDDLGSLPLQFSKLEQFSLIPFNQDFYISLEIDSRSENRVVANAKAHDDQGNIYLKIEQMQVTSSSRLNHLFLENTCSDLVCS